MHAAASCQLTALYRKPLPINHVTYYDPQHCHGVDIFCHGCTIGITQTEHKIELTAYYIATREFHSATCVSVDAL